MANKKNRFINSKLDCRTRVGTSKKAAKLIKGAKEIYYPGAPHGLTATHADQVNADLLEFLKQDQQMSKAA